MDEPTPLHTPEDDTLLQDQVKELQQLASKDALSGLLNRATMERHIKNRLAQMRPGETCALFIVDLDAFKQVNDTLGHRAGDRVIRQAAEILSQLFRASDIVGRLGGDEFMVFLCGQVEEALVRRKAAAISEHLRLVLGEHITVDLTASVGGVYATRPTSFETLYQEADRALYQAKRSGKDTYRLIMPDGEEAEGRPVNAIPITTLLEEMDNGIALLEVSDTLQIIYVSSSFCRICGSEQCRFPVPRPLQDLVHPDDFIELAHALRTGAAEGQTVEYNHRFYAEDSQRWIWLHIRASRVYDDHPEPVMLVTISDISALKDSQLALEAANSRLQAAFSQTAMGMWEVDLVARRVQLFETDGSPMAMNEEECDFPEGFIRSGWIHPDSVPQFRLFAREMLEGQVKGHGNFILRRHAAGGYSWTALSYQMLYDSVGNAIRAVGVTEDIPRSFGDPTLTNSIFQVSVPEGLLGDLILRARADLDLNLLETLWREGKNINNQSEINDCRTLLKQERARVFDENDAPHLFPYFNCHQLLRAFEEQRHWLYGEYRRIDDTGNIRWVRTVIHLAEEPTTGHCLLLVYILLIDQYHQYEDASTLAPRHDSISHLYDRQTLETIGRYAFTQTANGNCALAMIYCLGLTGPDLDRRHYEIAAVLQLALGGRCLIGQYSTDHIALVFPFVSDRDSLRLQLERAVAFLHQITQTEQPQAPLRFITGVSLLPARAADYSAMLALAAQACANHQDAAENVVVFAREEDHWSWNPLQLEEDTSLAVADSDTALPLTEQDQGLALRCVSTMLAARSLEASMNGVLQTLGRHYRADRVYTLRLTENDRVLAMTFEWTKTGKHSIQQSVSGMRLERFPVLQRCLTEGAPVSVSREKQIHRHDDDTEANVWHFSAFPFIEDGRITGFLCIENARVHPLDPALFDILLPYMLQERPRFTKAPQPEKTLDQLMGMPDLRTYMERVNTLTSEHYSTMGVVSLDVPNIAIINGNSGFEYGSRLLWFVAKTLIDLFDAELVFRTWETEFIAFLPNTTHEVFDGRLSRLRTILQRRYPKQVRLGQSWASGHFTGLRLVKLAKTQMTADQPEMSEELSSFFQKASDSLSGNDRSHRDQHFVAYYQPKIDLRTHALVGVEALARGIGDGGEIIMPAQFISFMEEDGSIRDLDLFILEHSLSQIDRWRQAGYGVVPLSVNLSRYSLAQPTTLASLLAIQSHYPLVPTVSLELEITERGEMEISDFQRAIDNYRSCGFHLALDDFGSRFANLALFTNVHFDTVKLDYSLIKGLLTNPVNQELVRDLIRICHTNDMTCIAEGVSNQEQEALLLDMGCQYAQGFYYDKPLPADVFAAKYLQPGASS